MLDVNLHAVPSICAIIVTPDGEVQIEEHDANELDIQEDSIWFTNPRTLVEREAQAAFSRIRSLSESRNTWHQNTSIDHRDADEPVTAWERTLVGGEIGPGVDKGVSTYFLPTHIGGPYFALS